MANPDTINNPPLAFAGSDGATNDAAIAKQRSDARNGGPKPHGTETVAPNLSDGRKAGVRERREFNADGDPTGSTLQSGQAAAPTREPKASS